MKEELLLHCCNQAWTKNGGQIRRSAIATCETFKTSCRTGKHLTNCDLVNHSRGPVIPFGSMVEYYPISAKDLSRIHQFGKKVLPGRIANSQDRTVWLRKWSALSAGQLSYGFICFFLFVWMVGRLKNQKHGVRLF